MKKILNLILRILLLTLTVVAEVLVGFCVLRLKMLPTALAVVFVALLVLLAAGLALLLFVHKQGAKVGWVRTVIGTVLSLGIIAGCLFGASLAADFYEAMLQITNAPKPNSERGVYVLVDDPATTIADAANYTFGTVTGYDENCTQQVLDALKEEIGFAVKVQAFESVTDMLDALYQKDIGALIMNGGYISILEEDDRYALFEEETRVLCTVPVIEEGKVEAPQIEPQELPNITNTPFVMYLSGQDARSKKLAVSRSDVNILVVVNPKTKQILMINTPRDYYVVHPYGNGMRDKLTHCGIYGVDCSVKALSNLYGIQIDYWAQINFEGFKKLIDEIGGVTIYSDSTFSGGGIQIVAGKNNLNGEQALFYARDRYHQSGGDNSRGKNQMKVIKAVIEKVTSGTTFIKNYSQIFASLDGMFSTSITVDQIGELARMQLTDMARWDIKSYAVNGYGDSQKTYSIPGAYAYVMHPKQETVDHATHLVQQVMEGKTLTEADMKLPE